MPVCQNATHVFNDNSRIATNVSLYTGDASQYDWTLDEGNILNTAENGQNELVLTLTETNGGTRLSSTRYLHYGTITTSLKAGRWDGVVAAFITMSDIKDEIDWEFPGNETLQGQTNYFWQGFVPTPTNGNTSAVSSDNFANWHNYTIDWQPTALTFSIDGQAVRTLNQADAVHNGISYYPNTPSRIQLSLWPAGINTSAPGTVQWSGGMINWNDPDYASAGHFYMRVRSVEVTCAPQSSSSSSNSSIPSGNITSYVYGANSSALTPSVKLSNASTLENGAVGGMRMGMGWSVVLGVVGVLVACGL